MADEDTAKNKVGKATGQVGPLTKSAEFNAEFGTAIAELFPHCKIMR